MLPRTTRDDGTPLQLAVVFGTPIEVDKMVRTDTGANTNSTERSVTTCGYVLKSGHCTSLRGAMLYTSSLELLLYT